MINRIADDNILAEGVSAIISGYGKAGAIGAWTRVSMERVLFLRACAITKTPLPWIYIASRKIGKPERIRRTLRFGIIGILCLASGTTSDENGFTGEIITAAVDTRDVKTNIIGPGLIIAMIRRLFERSLTVAKIPVPVGDIAGRLIYEMVIIGRRVCTIIIIDKSSLAGNRWITDLKILGEVEGWRIEIDSCLVDKIVFFPCIYTFPG